MKRNRTNLIQYKVIFALLIITLSCNLKKDIHTEENMNIIENLNIQDKPMEGLYSNCSTSPKKILDYYSIDNDTYYHTTTVNSASVVQYREKGKIKKGEDSYWFLPDSSKSKYLKEWKTSYTNQDRPFDYYQSTKVNAIITPTGCYVNSGIMNNHINVSKDHPKYVWRKCDFCTELRKKKSMNY